MAIKNTGLNLAGVRSNFFQAYDAAVEMARFNELTTRLESNKDSESYKFLGAIPRMREWGTGRKAVGVRTESYSVDNLKYESTIEVDRDEISDDQTGQIMLRIRELAARSAQHKDFLLSQLLINGAPTGFNSYDGVPFFNAAHVSGDSGSQSNILTPAAVDADAPTTAECKTALGAAIARMLGFVDDTGEPMSLDATGLVVVCPPTQYIAWLEALSATIIANTTNVLSGAAKIMPFSRLTDASKFYVLKTDVPVRPFVFQDREPLEFAEQAEGSSEQFMREKYYYGVRARYNVTYGYWQYALSCDFTAA
jgi:phage major head subunit gpT-like protein